VHVFVLKTAGLDQGLGSYAQSLECRQYLLSIHFGIGAKVGLIVDPAGCVQVLVVVGSGCHQHAGTIGVIKTINIVPGQCTRIGLIICANQLTVGPLVVTIFPFFIRAIVSDLSSAILWSVALFNFL
jgi:hypothetical protein